MKNEIISATVNATSHKYAFEIRKATAAYLRKRGMSNSEIAQVLGVSYHTVRNYIGKQPSKSFGGVFVKKQKPGPKSKTEKPVQTEKENPAAANVTPISELTLEKKLDLLLDSVTELVEILNAINDGAERGKHLKIV